VQISHKTRLAMTNSRATRREMSATADDHTIPVSYMKTECSVKYRARPPVRLPMNLHLQDTCTCVDWRRKRRSRSPSYSHALTHLLALSFTRLSLNAKDEVAAGGAVMTNDAFVPPNPKRSVSAIGQDIRGEALELSTQEEAYWTIL